MENELKQRNGCISFWLWIAIIVNMAMVIYYAVTMFSAYSSEAALGFGLCSIFGAVNVLSAILLLRWNKIGFYMMVVSSIMAIVVNICVLKMEPIAMIGSLFAIVIWWAILQMKKMAFQHGASSNQDGTGNTAVISTNFLPQSVLCYLS